LKTLPEIGKELAEMDTRIGKAMDESIMLRLDFKMKEALYKNEFAKNIMRLKAGNPTWRNPDIKAMAMNMTYEMQLEMIRAESRYLSKRNEAEQLAAIKETLVEESYNLRTELRKFVS